MYEDFSMELLGDEDDEYPKYTPSTTKEDLREATYVLGTPTTTHLDMELYCSEEDSDHEMLDNISLSNLAPRYKEVSLT